MSLAGDIENNIYNYGKKKPLGNGWLQSRVYVGMRMEQYQELLQVVT